MSKADERVETIVESNGDRHTIDKATRVSERRLPTTGLTSMRNEEPPTYCGPRVELVVTPDCPYATLAETLITMTLHQLGLPHTPVLISLIETTAEAVRREFKGSPSIIINGVDPWADADGEPGLACRVHASSAAGLPTPHGLAKALCAAVLEDRRVIG